MIPKEDIERIVKDYGEDAKIGTLCSHSALQIFHGAKQEGFKTVGICTKERMHMYNSFPRAKPDEFIVVDKFSDALKEEFQEKLRKEKVIMIPHGSFVEYVGPENIEERFRVPLFGNRETLEWEGNREKQREWLLGAGLKMPKSFNDPSEISNRVFVKFSGARGGRGFFIADSEKEFREKLAGKVSEGTISAADAERASIQEFMSGVRYYLHFFYSPFEEAEDTESAGRVEFLGADKRIEVIDEAYRGLPDVPEGFFDYTVTGNLPVVIRESLMPEIMRMGEEVVKESRRLFDPGMIGAFCLETMYHPKEGFRVFEISARIVAGTNLYPEGSPYSSYLFGEPMSTGRRIAREIKTGIKNGRLQEIVY